MKSSCITEKKGTEDLLRTIGELKKGPVKKIVDKRIGEFRGFRNKSSRDLFKELCFCIMTANSSAERCISIHKEIGDGFFTLSKERLQKRLKALGYRFHNRAQYLVDSRKYMDSLKEIIGAHKNEGELRDWLAENVKGLGYKEASHFLRNIGFKNFAIIDFHIVDVLVGYGIISKPKTVTRKKYLEIEDILWKIAGKEKLSLAELDLYLWYYETGKVLK